MKKKVGIIASSVATIAVCASMVAGSTYALFTSEDKVDIAITSGKVSVTADIGGTAYSAINLPAEIPDGYQVSYPTEGKAVATSNGVLNLENLIPGDKVELELKVVNTGTVSAQYQYKLECTDGEALMNQIKVTLGNSTDLTAEGGLKSYTSDWNTVDAGAEFTYSLTLSLPAKVGNAYQGLSTSIKTSVYAVQSNVATEENAESIENFPVVNSVDTLFSVAQNGGFAMLNEDMAITDTELEAAGGSKWITGKNYYGTILSFKGETEIDLNGHTLNLDKINFSVDGEDTVLNINNGTIKATTALNNSSIINVQQNATLILDNVNIIPSKEGSYAGMGYGIGCHDSSTIIIKDSKIVAGTALGSNASPDKNVTPNFVIENSILEGYACGVVFNVPGTLTVKDSEISGINQAVVLRSGTAKFTNCKLYNTLQDRGSDGYLTPASPSFNNMYSNTSNWGSGTNVPLSSLVVGCATASYNNQAHCELVNTEVIDTFGNYKDSNGVELMHYAVLVWGIDGGSTAVVYDAESKVASVKLINGGTYTLKAD